MEAMNARPSQRVSAARGELQVSAKAATDALSRQTFLDLAKSWSRLAAELEDAAAFLTALKNLEIRRLLGEFCLQPE